MENFYYGHMFGWGIWGWLMMPLFWGGIILLVVWLVREVSGTNSSRSNRALEILKERYAKGEISQEEFEAKKKDLTS